MTLLARTRALTGQEWLVLLEAAALTPVAAMAVRGLPLPKAVAFVRVVNFGRCVSPLARTDTPLLALDRLSTLVEWSASRFGARCLVQAIVLQATLRSRGVRSDLVVGAAPGEAAQTLEGSSLRALVAHAWVEHEGSVLMGGAEVQYVPLYRLSSDPATEGLA
jgi:Transglutaminase-like superfamily